MNRGQLLLRTLILSLGGLACAASGYWLALFGPGSDPTGRASDHPLPASGKRHLHTHGNERAPKHNDENESVFAKNPFKVSSPHHQHRSESEFLTLSAEAVRNLELELGSLKNSHYVQETMLPGELVALPGVGRQYVSAPVKGVVTDIFIQPGQSINKTTTLLTMTLTDEELATTQRNTRQFVTICRH